MNFKIKNTKKYAEILNKYESPVYIYDYETLKARCDEMKEFKDELENSLNGIKVNMHYSPKANTNPAILKVVNDSGLSVDSMSPFELDICEKSGFEKDRILYVCNNIDRNEMKLVNEKGILICLDSISQVEEWGKVCPNTEIIVRINPGIRGVGFSEKTITSGKATKFGISEENLQELFEVADKYGVKIIGTHQHLGSLFLNDKIDNYIQGVEAGLEIVKKYFKDVKIVDLGGGFGVPYKEDEEKLNLKNVAEKLENVLKEFLKEYPSVQEFKFEPGRFITCESGTLAGTVTAVKHENGTWWIGTDLGMNQLVRPSMYDSYHYAEIITDNEEEIVANICGNVCESGDIMAKDRKVKKPNVGDMVLIYNAGAYGYTMASNYTGRPRPAEVMVNGEEEKLIRKRETIELMESNIIW